MTVHNQHASHILIVAVLAMPFHVGANEPDGLAKEFQATAADAAATFKAELEINLAKSIPPPMRLDASLVVATKGLAGVEGSE